MTLKNNRAHLLAYFTICASFRSHCELKLDLQSETRNSGQKRWFIIPCNLEISQMTLKDYRAPLLWHINFVHNFIVIYEFKLELQSGNGWIRFWPSWPWPHLMMIPWGEYSEKVWRAYGQAEPSIEQLGHSYQNITQTTHLKISYTNIGYLAQTSILHIIHRL